MKSSIIVLSLVVLAGCAARSTVQDAATNPQIRDFNARIESYMRIRETAVRGLVPSSQQMTASEIDAARNTLAARIRAARPDARPGSIFTPEIRTHFRLLLAGPLAGPGEEAIRELIKQDLPAPGAVPLEVNGTYPIREPVATTPPSFLALLPTLPDSVQYRFIGRDMVLLDPGANLIIDYMRNALPPPGAPGA